VYPQKHTPKSEPSRKVTWIAAVVSALQHVSASTASAISTAIAISVASSMRFNFIHSHSNDASTKLSRMPSPSSSAAAFIEPSPSLSLPFIIFNHADTLIRLAAGGFIDLNRLGPLHSQHDADAVLDRFKEGKWHAYACATPDAAAGMALAGLEGIDGNKQCPVTTKWVQLRVWFALHYCCRWDIAKYARAAAAALRLLGSTEF
jgi:hypothetical protein